MEKSGTDTNPIGLANAERVNPEITDDNETKTDVKEQPEEE